jgi:predicted metal-binding transcription factor (methanogenesis marker protein 9)
MSREDGDPSVDLSLSPERMMRIRDGVRELLVQHIHALRIASRAFRKAGIHDRARRCETEAGRLTRAVATLDNPMSMLTFPPGDDPDHQAGK